MNFAESESWLERSKKVIPGAAQTFSKGTNQFVNGVSPIFLSHGKGAHVWDVDGNKYIDYIQGLLPNILGYANEEVNQAFYEQVDRGHSFSLPHPLEVTLAEKLCEIIPCAEMVRFGKNGSDATAGAVRLARAYTGRDHVACCGYHGWQDWFIGSTTRNLGVPQAVRELTHPFVYNDIASLETIFAKFDQKVAAVIMEPVNFVMPKDGFLEEVKALAQKHGAVLIFDEICTGFHLGLGGAQKRLGVTPDLACFGKAMGNGYPISALVGKKEIMKTCEEIFFSFTFAGEVGSIAASLKVIEILEKTDALNNIQSNGSLLQNGIRKMLKKLELENAISCVGYPEWSLLQFKDLPNANSLLVRSLLQQEMVAKGILMLVTHNMTASHSENDIENTLDAYQESLEKVAEYLSSSNPSQFLQGAVIESVFKVR